jgi:hypothetical protein
MELMRSQGHEVRLFSTEDTSEFSSEFSRHFVAVADLECASLPTKANRAMRAIYSLEARKRVRAMLVDFRPEVAHVRNIYHHLSPSILWELKAHGVPVLYHLNDFKVICPSYNMVSSSGEACERCQGGKFWNVVHEGCYSGGRAASGVLAAEAYFHQWLGTYRKCVDLVLAPSRFVKSKLVANGWLEKPSSGPAAFSKFADECRPSSRPDGAHSLLRKAFCRKRRAGPSRRNGKASRSASSDCG